MGSSNLKPKQYLLYQSNILKGICQAAVDFMNCGLMYKMGSGTLYSNSEIEKLLQDSKILVVNAYVHPFKDFGVTLKKSKISIVFG